MSATILFIDDDRRLIKEYADMAKESGFAVECFYRPDSIMTYAKSGKPADVIVWDMMMAPGKVFAEEDTNAGLTTGVLLYKGLSAIYPEALFILLTNDSHSGALYDKPQERSYALFKPATKPKDLLSMIKKTLLKQEGRKHGDKAV